MQSVKRKRRCETQCQQHIFSIRNLKNNNKYDVKLTFCPKYQRQPLPPQHTFAQFNKDSRYFTPAFVLGIESKFIAKNLQRQMLQHQKQIKQNCQKYNQIVFPRPNSKHTTCSVCKQTYTNYYTHIFSHEHGEKIQCSSYNEQIKQLCTLFFNHWEGCAQKADNEAYVLRQKLNEIKNKQNQELNSQQIEQSNEIQNAEEMKKQGESIQEISSQKEIKKQQLQRKYSKNNQINYQKKQLKQITHKFSQDRQIRKKKIDFSKYFQQPKKKIILDNREAKTIYSKKSSIQFSISSHKQKNIKKLQVENEQNQLMRQQCEQQIDCNNDPFIIQKNARKKFKQKKSYYYIKKKQRQQREQKEREQRQKQIQPNQNSQPNQLNKQKQIKSIKLKNQIQNNFSLQQQYEFYQNVQYEQYLQEFHKNQRQQKTKNNIEKPNDNKKLPIKSNPQILLFQIVQKKPYTNQLQIDRDSNFNNQNKSLNQEDKIKNYNEKNKKTHIQKNKEINFEKHKPINSKQISSKNYQKNSQNNNYTLRTDYLSASISLPLALAQRPQQQQQKQKQQQAVKTRNRIFFNNSQISSLSSNKFKKQQPPQQHYKQKQTTLSTQYNNSKFNPNIFHEYELKYKAYQHQQNQEKHNYSENIYNKSTNNNIKNNNYKPYLNEDKTKLTQSETNTITNSINLTKSIEKQKQSQFNEILQRKSSSLYNNQNKLEYPNQSKPLLNENYIYPSNNEKQSKLGMKTGPLVHHPPYYSHLPYGYPISSYNYHPTPQHIGKGQRISKQYSLRETQMYERGYYYNMWQNPYYLPPVTQIPSGEQLPLNGGTIQPSHNDKINEQDGQAKNSISDKQMKKTTSYLPGYPLYPSYGPYGHYYPPQPPVTNQNTTSYHPSQRPQYPAPNPHSVSHPNPNMRMNPLNTNISINFPMYMPAYHPPYGYSQRGYPSNSTQSSASNLPSASTNGLIGPAVNNSAYSYTSNKNSNNLPPYAEYQQYKKRQSERNKR